MPYTDDLIPIAHQEIYGDEITRLRERLRVAEALLYAAMNGTADTDAIRSFLALPEKLADVDS